MVLKINNSMFRVFCLTTLITLILFLKTADCIASIGLNYQVSVEKAESTASIVLLVTGNESSTIILTFKTETKEHEISKYISELSVISESKLLPVQKVGEGRYQVDGVKDRFEVHYRINKMIPYGSYNPHIKNENYAVYIDDEVGFIMAPFFFIYPEESESRGVVNDIRVTFNLPQGWDIVTPWKKIADEYIVSVISRSLWASFINSQQLYFGPMEFYAESMAGNCKVIFGVPKASIPQNAYYNYQFTQEKVEAYVQATAKLLEEYMKIFGEIPFSVFAMYTDQIWTNDKQKEFPGGRYPLNGWQYWPKPRWDELARHMVISYIDAEGGGGPLMLADSLAVAKLVEYYYGLRLAYDLWPEDQYLASLYYWYLLYERMQGTAAATKHFEFNNYLMPRWIAFLLDQKIMEATEKEKRLDDVWKVLSNSYKRSNYKVGYKDIKDAAEQVTGEDFSGFFSRFVFGQEKLPLKNYVSGYRQYFMNYAEFFEDNFYVELNGYLIPLFIIMEFVVQDGSHLMSGMRNEGYLDTFYNHIIANYNIESLTEAQVEEALSTMTKGDSTGFFDRWNNSFGRLSINELKDYLDSLN